MTRLSFLLPTISILLSGCMFFERREVTQSEKEALVLNASRAATVLAISEIAKTPKEKVEIALKVHEVVFTKALPAFDNPNFLAKEGEDKLLEQLPPELRPLLAVALETFHTYYRIKSPTELVTPEQAGFIKAFLVGVGTGADAFLELK